MPMSGRTASATAGPAIASSPKSTRSASRPSRAVARKSISRRPSTARGLRPADRLPVARELGETSLAFLTHPTLTAGRYRADLRGDRAGVLGGRRLALERAGRIADNGAPGRHVAGHHGAHADHGARRRSMVCRSPCRMTAPAPM